MGIEEKIKKELENYAYVFNDTESPKEQFWIDYKAMSYIVNQYVFHKQDVMEMYNKYNYYKTKKN